MSQPNQYSDIKKPNPDDVQALFDAGYSRNEIARRLEVSQHQVNLVAQDRGLEFNQELTRDAVAARVSRANEQRIELSDSLRKIAAIELKSLIDGLQSANDRKAMMTTAAIAVQRDIEIAQYIDSRFPDDDGMAEASSKFDELVAAINASTENDPYEGLTDMEMYEIEQARERRKRRDAGETI